jgi:hypothetical protein
VQIINLNVNYSYFFLDILHNNNIFDDKQYIDDKKQICIYYNNINIEDKDIILLK